MGNKEGWAGRAILRNGGQLGEVLKGEEGKGGRWGKGGVRLIQV